MAAAAAAAAAARPAEEGEKKDATEEDDVEEQLVMVELSGIIDSDFLEKCENKCKILVSDYSTIGKGYCLASSGLVNVKDNWDWAFVKYLLLERWKGISQEHATDQNICEVVKSILKISKGVETERPILQVDRYVFAGEYEDTLGTCVFFEENTEHDAEGNQKVHLKYKCHTMKKLNMTRILLTEKKEGEENVGGVEWLQIKDRDFSHSRLNSICSFLREKEDSEESAQAQDKMAEESEEEVSGGGNSDINCDLEKQHSLEIDASLPPPDSPASDAGDSSASVALGSAPP